MVENKVGSISLVSTGDTISGPAGDLRPALKSRIADYQWENSRPTSAANSPDSVSEPRPLVRHERGKKGSHRATSRSTADQDYRRICIELESEAMRARDHLEDGKLRDTGMEVVIEVEQLLDELYANGSGKHECLKRAVVAIGSQIYNVRWTEAQVAFLQDVANLLNASYLIDDSLVRECLKLIKSHNLELFRGTVAETEVRKNYRITEVD
jgi:hypothetical protein